MGTTSMTQQGERETSLANYYAAERRAGADPVLACERMAEFAKRLDDLYAARQGQVANIMERS